MFSYLSLIQYFQNQNKSMLLIKSGSCSTIASACKSCIMGVMSVFWRSFVTIIFTFLVFMKIHEHSLPWTIKFFSLNWKLTIFIFVHHLFMNYELWMFSWILFMNNFYEPVKNPLRTIHEQLWTTHKGS